RPRVSTARCAASWATSRRRRATVSVGAGFKPALAQRARIKKLRISREYSCPVGGPPRTSRELCLPQPGGVENPPSESPDLCTILDAGNTCRKDLPVDRRVTDLLRCG